MLRAARTETVASARRSRWIRSTTSLDPILFTDRTTGRTFESQLAGKTALTCYTDDDGDTWTTTTGSGINSGVDHQTIGGGPFAGNGLGALTGYPDAVYDCSQDIADAWCASSHDGGLIYGPAVPIYDLTQCGGLHGHVEVDPVTGTVYVPNKGCGAGQAVAVSEDDACTGASAPLARDTVVVAVDERDDGRTVLTGVVPAAEPDVLADLQQAYAAAGITLTEGETEERDAESNFSGSGLTGRWGIRALEGCTPAATRIDLVARAS